MKSKTLIVVAIAAGMLFAGAAGAWAQNVKKAESLNKQAKYDAAGKILAKAVQKDPKNGETHLQYGIALTGQGKNAPAEEQFGLAVDNGVPKETMLVGKANVCIERGNLPKAEEALGEAVKIAPENADVQYARGLLYARQENHAASAEALEKTLSLDSERAYAHYYAGLAYNHLNNPNKMLDHFRLFLKMAPNAPEAEKVKVFMGGLKK